MTLLEILKGARELIATPDKWTKGVGARDKDGNPTEWGSASPDTCRCLYAALEATAGMGGGGTERDQMFAVALDFFDIGYLIRWNDDEERTHADVLARLDVAIAAEEAKVTP